MTTTLVKRIVYLAITVVATMPYVHAQNVSIPDANFKAALLAHTPIIDTNDDDEIQVSEAVAFTGKLSLANQGIADLTGIEAFVNLTRLDVNQNALTSVDLTANTALVWLSCWQNDLTAIDLTNLTALNYLHLGDNELGSIDVSQNTALDTLVTFINPIGSLDVTNNTELLWLLPFDNNLSSIDLSNNPNLKYLSIGTNPMSSLNLSSNSMIETLLLTAMPNMTSIDLSNQTSLKTLFAQGAFTSFDLTGLAALESLTFNNNSALSEVTLSGNTNLQSFGAGDCQISSLDFSECPNLTGLSVTNNQLTSLNITNGNNEAITFFNLLGNPDLSCISVDDIDYATTNFLNIPEGTTFQEDCNNPTIQIPDAAFLAGLLAHSGSIDSDGNGKIGEVEAAAFSGNLDLAGLGITSIRGIEYFTGVTGINLNSNPLIAADISQNPAINSFSCTNCELRVLDVANGNNTNFTTFNVTGNADLTCINVDNSSYSNSNWTNIPNGTGFSIDCIVNIPNAAFKTKLTTHVPDIDTDDNGQIQLSEAKAFTGLLNASNNTSITDVIGLEAFQNITGLWLSNDGVTSADLSQNTQLTEFYIPNNSLLAELHITNLPNLLKLSVSSTRAGVLDISNSTKLTELTCSNSRITSLDLSNNKRLAILSAGQNAFGSIDLSANVDLDEVYLSSCSLYTLDLTNNPGIWKLNVTNNANLSCVQVSDVDYANGNANYVKGTNTIFSLDCPPAIPDANLRNALLNHVPVIDTNDDNLLQLAEKEAFTGTLILSSKGINDATGLENFVNITGLDISSNQSLSNLDVSVFSDLTTLNVSFTTLGGTLDLSSNPDLESLECSGSGLTNLTVTSNPKLTDLDASNNQFTTIDLTNNTKLTSIKLDNTAIAAIDLSSNTLLEELNLRLTELSAIDVSTNTALTFLDITQLSGGLNSLDLSSNVDLVTLFASGNGVASITFGNNTALTELYLGGHQLTSIDVSNLTALQTLILSSGTLGTLDLSGNPDLEYLSADENALTDLNLTANTNLTEVYVNTNQLMSVDLSGLTLLTDIYLYDNDLTSVDFSTNTALYSVDIYENAITSLDFSNNSNLVYLYAVDNDLYWLNLANGNNSNMEGMEVYNNPNLVCITVDDVAYAEANFSDIDEGVTFSTGCGNYETEILSFAISGETGNAAIDGMNHTITLEVSYFTGLINLSPVIALSSGATVSPESGSPSDFSNPVEYTVIAENGVTQEIWTVTVTLADPSDATDIVTFSFEEQTGPATIDDVNHTVGIEVASGTDVTSLIPTIGLSTGAGVSPNNGAAQDFTDPVTYTVTAEDEVTSQEWTVTVSIEEITLGADDLQGLSIYPNPTRNLISIEGVNQRFTMRLLNLDGRELLNVSNQNVVDMSTFKAGMYLLHVELADGSRKVIRISKVN